MMDVKRNRSRRLAQLFWTLIGSCLLCSCFASADIVPAVTMSAAAPILSTPTSTPLPGPWQIVGIYNADQSIMTAGFLNEQVVATGGVVRQMGYSNDGALLTVISGVNQLTLLRYEE